MESNTKVAPHIGQDTDPRSVKGGRPGYVFGFCRSCQSIVKQVNDDGLFHPRERTSDGIREVLIDLFAHECPGQSDSPYSIPAVEL